MTEEDMREIVIQAFNNVIGEREKQSIPPDTLTLALNTNTGGVVGAGNRALAPGGDPIPVPDLAQSVPDLVQELLEEPGNPPDASTSPPLTGLSGIIDEASAALSATPRQPPSTKTTQPGSGDSTTAVVARTALSILSLGAVPLVSGILKLFGGGTPEPPAPLVPYSLPPSLQFDAVNPHGSSQFEAAVYGQEGLPRLPNAAQRVNHGGAFSGGGPNPATEPVIAPQITIQVNAMDSRSFLDHSNEIAQAVREAMLNMHSINDVVSDF